MKEIPESVMHQANSLVELYGNNIEYLGEYMGTDVYRFVFPENSITGYPYVFLYDREDGTADTITGLMAVDIISKFLKE